MAHIENINFIATSFVCMGTIHNESTAGADASVEALKLLSLLALLALVACTKNGK